MKVSDIIEAAPRMWWDEESLKRHDCEVYEEDVPFIATFDPEHVRLMEGVVRAARHGLTLRDLENPMRALLAYRAERGLE